MPEQVETGKITLSPGRGKTKHRAAAEIFLSIAPGNRDET